MSYTFFQNHCPKSCRTPGFKTALLFVRHQFIPITFQDYIVKNLSVYGTWCDATVVRYHYVFTPNSERMQQSTNGELEIKKTVSMNSSLCYWSNLIPSVFNHNSTHTKKATTRNIKQLCLLFSPTNLPSNDKRYHKDHFKIEWVPIRPKLCDCNKNIRVWLNNFVTLFLQIKFCSFSKFLCNKQYPEKKLLVVSYNDFHASSHHYRQCKVNDYTATSKPVHNAGTVLATLN